uniref:MFS transporter n=1 Tax=Thermorudis peleae TaxID=1382356 RepID=A0A831TEL0_9BACT
MRLPWVLRDPSLRVVLLLSALAGLISGLVVPFISLIARDRGASYALIGLMASGFLISQAVLQFPAGALSDRIGRAIPIAAGLVVEGLATAAFAFTTAPELFVLLRLAQGVGLALIYPSARALIVDLTPPERRGQAFAAWWGALNGGWLLGPALGGVLAGIIGKAPLFVVGGLGEVALGALVLATIGQLSSGRPLPRLIGERVPYRALLAAPLVAAFILALGFEFPVGIFTGIWSVYLADLGASEFELGISYTTFSVTNLLFLPLGGRLADRAPRWRRLLVLSLALGVVVIGYSIPSVPAILLLGALEGAIIGLLSPSVDAYLASVSDPRVQGRVQGAYTTAGMAGAATSALLSSVLYEAGRPVPFLTGGLTLLVLATVAIGLIRKAEQAKGTPLRRVEPLGTLATGSTDPAADPPSDDPVSRSGA